MSWLKGGVHGLVLGVAGCHVLTHPVLFVVLIGVLAVADRVFGEGH